MPEVGYSREPEHHDLKSVEGGYVKLRRLPYSEILKRREMGTRLSMEQTSRRGRRQEKEQDQKLSIELMQTITREYEFANCIVDHNLTVDGVPVDFTQPKLAFQNVNPKVLEEIELLLSDLNDEADEEELQDFTKRSSQSSSNEPTLGLVTTDPVETT